MSTLATNAITDASGGNTASINGYTPTVSNMAGRNRIINGDMRIDARNAGAAVTANGAFPVDRFVALNDSDGAFSAQQDTVAPTGFVNSLKFTTTTADASLGATQYAAVQHRIEGLNVADLAWGTANAQPVTVSFWVRSSLTGAFGGVVANSAANRSYPFTYTISAANTWEQKSITIEGDTSGTWLTTNGIGIRVTFGLGAGSSFSGTAGAWSGSTLVSATGAVSVIGTLNATWQITGVQLEVGSVATPFEHRMYGQELALCQRYYQKWGGNATYERIATGYAISTTSMEVFIPRFYVPFRAAPSLNANSISNFRASEASGSFTATAISISQASPLSCGIAVSVASGLTTNRPMSMDTNNTTSALLSLSAEL